MGKPKYEWQEWAVTPDANDLPEDQVRHQIKVRVKGQATQFEFFHAYVYFIAKRWFYF